MVCIAGAFKVGLFLNCKFREVAETTELIKHLFSTQKLHTLVHNSKRLKQK